MASLSSPESRIKAAVQPGIKNQTRCAGRNQESRISRGGQTRGDNLPCGSGWQTLTSDATGEKGSIHSLSHSLLIHSLGLALDRDECGKRPTAHAAAYMAAYRERSHVQT